MAVSKPIIASGIVGGGAPVTAGVYYSTKVSVKNEIYNDVLPWDDMDTVWEKLQDELKSDNDEDSLEEGMKANKTLINNDENDVVFNASENGEPSGQVKDPRIKVKGDLVKYWCMDNYNRNIWSLIGGSDDTLLSTAKKYCVYKIEKKITDSGKSKLADDGNETKLKEKLKALKDNTHNKKLDSELKVLSKLSDIEERTDDLKNWCKKQYERGFKGDNSDSWMRFDFFCLGDSAQAVV